jgi:hypothetical protein
LVISLIYLVIVRCCAAVLTYTTIFLVLGSLIGLGVLFWWRMEYYKDLGDETYKSTMYALAIVFWVLGGIWLLVILFMCNSIRLSIALIECSAQYVFTTFTLVFVPLVLYILTGLFYAYWVALSVYIYSSGTVDSKSTGIFVNIKW